VIARFKVVTMFLIAVLAALVFWGFVLRIYAINHPDNNLVKGLVGLGVV
jgi:hypothetical protein